MPIHANRVATGLAAPLYGTSPPGDPNRLFVLEKDTGRVVILDLTTNQVLPQPFFDVPQNQMTNDGERGLLGLAFHPDYATNGRFYLNLTNENGNTEIWELTRSANPDVANATPNVILTVFRDPALNNHNGGWIGFGPDGFLYIATGDGGSANDPNNNAQNINDLRGKMLRIDVNSDAFPADPGRNYSIAPNNPFAGPTNGADEVFAYGLRNPWRASFDSATGDFYIADVGQNAREELNYLPAGSGAGTNFGWRVLEGNLPTGLGAVDPSMRAPVLDYPHGLGNLQGQTIIGGYVYHGPGGAQGLYFFGDFVSNHIFTTHVENGQAFDFAQRDHEVVENGGSLDQLSSFAVDGMGRLYAIDLDGDIFHLAPTSDVGPVPGEPVAFGDEGGGDWGEALLVAGALLGLAAWLF